MPARSLARDVAGMLLATALSGVLFSLIFPPITWWPLAFVCLAPWALAVTRTERAWVVHWGSFVGGWLIFLWNLKWLAPVTGLGFAALAFYLAVYWAAAAWAIRTGLRVHLGVTWTLPVAWTACEFLRAWVMSGFPWLFLAHSFYQQSALIQISDVTGAYGVSFLAAMVSGLIVDVVRRFAPGRGPRPGTWALVAAGGATGALLIGALLYGRMRLAEQTIVAGPRVAVVQEDFPLVTAPPWGEHPYVVFARYMALAAEAAQQHPDLLVFPETPWHGYQNIDFLEVERRAVEDVPAGAWSYGQRTHRATAALARGDYAAVNAEIAALERVMDGRKLPRLGPAGGPAVTVVVGSLAIEVFPDASYPQVKKYNAALVYEPDGTQRRERYDKMHLVPFGESVPFRNARVLGVSLHWLYRWLNSLSPFSDGGKNEYSLWAGDEHRVFELHTPQRAYRFATPICYEDVMPYIVRNFVWDGAARRTDFVLNISNDGWFQYSAELEQHLAICAFRAVENRVGIARAVNTGISGFVDPNGRIYSLVRGADRLVGPGVVGYRVDHVRIDTRASLYGRFGDVFASACLLGAAGLWLGAIFTRWVRSLGEWLARRRGRREVRA